MTENDVGIFTHNGMHKIQPGMEEKFFSGAGSSVKVGIGAMNALGIVSLKAMRELEPVLRPNNPGGPERIIAALERGIEMAGGDPEESVEKATALFQEMPEHDKHKLLSLWVS